jgi:hypothetical protein
MDSRYVPSSPVAEAAISAPSGDDAIRATPGKGTVPETTRPLTTQRVTALAGG